MKSSKIRDEIESRMIASCSSRLSLAYDKAKEYVGKISLGIDQQMNSWINRRQIIQMETSSSYDFLVPKTQRINELTLEAVEGLTEIEMLDEHPSVLSSIFSRSTVPRGVIDRTNHSYRS